MEYCDANLYEIINFRRKNSWKWAQEELNQFVHDISEALNVMAQFGIAHRDIRPFNIWYSVEKKKYKLGGFSEAKVAKRI
jgi:hypothetical protein